MKFTKRQLITIIFALLFFSCALLFSQDKPRLGILPFSGGNPEDGETIATLFSYQPEIMQAFTVVPRTGAVNALTAERQFQEKGYTDSDTIARLGRQLNADFVVSGYILQLGNSSLVVATIINVETFELLAGDYREYQRIEDVPGLLPAIAKNMVNAARRNTAGLQKLAIAPFSVMNRGINVEEAETLAHILAIEIANTGKYAVLPRTSTTQTALSELKIQESGATSDIGVKAIGRASNAQYVLAAEARSLGRTNMFTAQILHVEDASQLIGGAQNYKTIEDALDLMTKLAAALTKGGSAKKEALPHEAAYLWTAGASLGSSFAPPYLIALVRGTIAPFGNFFFEAGCDFGFISGIADVGYYSFYPFVHYAFFMPFTQKSGWYAGAGGGWMVSTYTFPEGEVATNTPALDISAGLQLWDFLNVSYTLRTNFSGVSHKISAGWTYRFLKKRGNE